MSITVTISSALEKVVRQEATARGIDVETVVRELLEKTYAEQTKEIPKRPYGLCAGAFRVPEDFDAPLPEEILNAFEG